MPEFKKDIVENLAARLDHGIRYLDGEGKEASALERLAVMKKLAADSLLQRTVANVDTGLIVKRMTEAHSVLVEALRRDGDRSSAN